MRKRHSFCLTAAGKVIDGCGLTDSHTTIMDLHGLRAVCHDTCNLYEWQPPAGWPDANYAGGLTVDKAAFETKQRHEDAIARHLKRLYPTADSWTTPDAIRWSELPLPNPERVQRAYELALRARPLGNVDDETILNLVNLHLLRLGCGVKATTVANAAHVRVSVLASVRDSVWASARESVLASVWASVWDSVRASVWASVWESVRDSVWDSVRDSVLASVWVSVLASVWASVLCAMVREDDDNPWLPLAELATHGVYLYSVADDGTAYVWMKGKP